MPSNENLRGYIRYLPEMHYTQTAKAVINFKLFHSPEITENDDDNGIRITCWEQVAEQCAQFLQVGDKLFLSGYYKDNIFTTKAGEEITSRDFTANKVFIVKEEDGIEQYSDILKIENRIGSTKKIEIMSEVEIPVLIDGIKSRVESIKEFAKQRLTENNREDRFEIMKTLEEYCNYIEINCENIADMIKEITAPF